MSKYQEDQFKKVLGGEDITITLDDPKGKAVPDSKGIINEMMELVSYNKSKIAENESRINRIREETTQLEKTTKIITEALNDLHSEGLI